MGCAEGCAGGCLGCVCKELVWQDVQMGGLWGVLPALLKECVSKLVYKGSMGLAKAMQGKAGQGQEGQGRARQLQDYAGVGQWQDTGRAGPYK